MWCGVNPRYFFFFFYHYSKLLIQQTNLFSGNDVPLGSATASSGSWWMDQSCSSQLLRGLCSCSVQKLWRQGDLHCFRILWHPPLYSPSLEYSAALSCSYVPNISGQPVRLAVKTQLILHGKQTMLS